VTLEQDLARRDLTINAIAQDEHGTLTDPYGGVRDIEQRVLRHVSPMLSSEDPVRVLRVARFAARFAPLGFTVADETMTLLQQMVRDGEVDHLVPERVWAETRKALTEAQPSAFRACAARTQARWPCCFRKSTRCMACRSARSFIPKSIPACIWKWCWMPPRGWHQATTWSASAHSRTISARR
jgi:hypothetical protein